MNQDTGYAGDVSPNEAWVQLTSDSSAILVDVRTKAEWSFVGIPDLSEIGKSPILLEWQIFPEMEINEGFGASLTNTLEQNGLGQDVQIFMLCRSGARSRSAAQTMTLAGYGHCYNIATGFEGGLDESGKRGRISGWKADGLSWRQG